MIVRIVIGVLFFVSVLSAKADKLHKFTHDTDVFLKKYVSTMGVVDYKSISKNLKEIEQILHELAAIHTRRLDTKEAKSMYLNAYNIVSIYYIARQYPVESPLDIEGLYKRRKTKVAHELLTLHEIEQRLWALDKDKRVLFAINGGAKAYPPIHNFAYTPEKVNQELDYAVLKSCINEYFIRVKSTSKKMLLSEWFLWHKEKISEVDLFEMINKYRPDDKKIPNSYTVGYYPFVWKLNE